jgi:periplasmic protein TonB
MSEIYAAPMGSVAKRIKPGRLAIVVLPWFIGVLLILSLVALILLMKAAPAKEPDTLMVRSLDVAVPPPPEPPPPVKVQAQTTTAPSPTIDLFGVGEGPSLSYARNPELTLDNLQRVEKPEFDKNTFDLSSNLSVDFPLLEVKELDSVPRLLSNNRISFPRQLREKGIDRVTTKVEIIIDQQGKAYVKKIVDPVYPEMADVIRKAINDSKFTTPTKNGRPVQAIYLYTLVFINRT